MEADISNFDKQIAGNITVNIPAQIVQTQLKSSVTILDKKSK